MNQTETAPDNMSRAVDILHSGGVIAFPTETYYGLAADPFNNEAMLQLFALKKRQACKPILTLIEKREQLPLLVEDVPVLYEKLMDAFWPGPLTLVFRAAGNISAQLTGNTGTVGIRISSHPVAQKLVQAFGKPITATSANISGLAPCLTGEEVLRQLGSGVQFVLDGNATRGGKCSTLVSLRDNKLQLVREGAISFQKITALLGFS